MTLVDSSVWIDHFRVKNPALNELMGAGQLLVHPFVLGELSLGRAYESEAALKRLSQMEIAPIVPESEVAGLVQAFKLWGRGIGWIDCHLLASARELGVNLWTSDKALRAAWRQVRPKY
jgi:predicted nucleic acid-binding protein